MSLVTSICQSSPIAASLIVEEQSNPLGHFDPIRFRVGEVGNFRHHHMSAGANLKMKTHYCLRSASAIQLHKQSFIAAQIDAVYHFVPLPIQE